METKILPTFLISITVLSLVSIANAGIFHADNSKPYPGKGSTISPYCSLTIATTNRQCGDIVKVRTGSEAYNETIIIDQPSCPDSAPIVVQADDGHQPILTSRAGPSVTALFNLVNVSNWRVEGLIFDGKHAGGDGTTTPQYALMAQAPNVDVTGIVFRQNRIRNWALSKNFSAKRGAALAFQGNQSRKKFVFDSLITENMVENVRGTGIYMSHARNSTISKNDISKLLCKIRLRNGIMHAGVVGIKENNIATTLDNPSADTMENVVEENVIHDFPDGRTCSEESGMPAYDAAVLGYACDVGAKAGMVRRNKIYNIGYHPERPLYGSRGILIESRCHGYTAEGNEISKIGGSGIEIRNANDTQILHNTISDAQLAGVNFKDGARAVIMENIFSTSPGSGITIGSAAWQDGGHTIDYNFYDLVGRPGAIFGVTVPKTFVGWQQACHCEAHGRMGDLLAAPK